MQIDHIISHRDFKKIKKIKNKKKKLIDYGIDSYENLNPACSICNHSKDALTIEEFRHEIWKRARTYKMTARFRLALKYGLIKLTKKKKVKFYFEKGNYV